MACKTCKKKVVKELESVIEEQIDLDIPTIDEIKIAYAELTSYGGVKPEKKEFIKKIYMYIFKEELDLDCRGCGSYQVQKFTNYLNKNNIKV